MQVAAVSMRSSAKSATKRSAAAAEGPKMMEPSEAGKSKDKAAEYAKKKERGYIELTSVLLSLFYHSLCLSPLVRRATLSAFPSERASL